MNDWKAEIASAEGFAGGLGHKMKGVPSHAMGTLYRSECQRSRCMAAVVVTRAASGAEGIERFYFERGCGKGKALLMADDLAEASSAPEFGPETYPDDGYTNDDQRE